MLSWEELLQLYKRLNGGETRCSAERTMWCGELSCVHKARHLWQCILIIIGKDGCKTVLIICFYCRLCDVGELTCSCVQDITETFIFLVYNIDHNEKERCKIP